MAKSKFFRFDANVTPQGVTKSKKFFANSNFIVVINLNLRNMIKFGDKNFVRARQVSLEGWNH